jgi:hypothetical protein
MNKNWKKIQLKKINIFVIKIASMLQERPSASKREHPALQKRIFLIFSIIVGHFPLLDPDPDPAD